MSFRPWAVATAFIVALLVNFVLMTQEKVPDPMGEDEVERIDEPLRHVIYDGGTRIENFLEFGMPQELADATFNNIRRYGKQRARFIDMLDSKRPLAARAFCSVGGDSLPQPYAAMELLVKEENSKRDVIPAGELLEFENQPWFGKASVDEVYNKMEIRSDRRSDATVLAIGGLLAGREADIIQLRSPFGGSGGILSSGLGRLQRDSPRVRQLLIEYFSLMHFLTELANADKGICGG